MQGPGLLGSSHFVERANSLNRPLRTRTVGGVGAGGEKPPATRLAVASYLRSASDGIDVNQALRLSCFDLAVEHLGKSDQPLQHHNEIAAVDEYRLYGLACNE